MLLNVLEDTDALSQVCFVHDDIQLVFQDYGLSLFNPVRVDLQARVYRQGAPGFCDAIVSLIGLKVVNVSMVEREVLSLRFEGGASVSVSLHPDDATGPEAFEFRGPNALCVVEQNA